jgi:hypothetical protein
MGVEPTQDLIGPDTVLKTAEAAGPLPSPVVRFRGVSAGGCPRPGLREVVKEVVCKVRSRDSDRYLRAQSTGVLTSLARMVGLLQELNSRVAGTTK